MNVLDKTNSVTFANLMYPDAVYARVKDDNYTQVCRKFNSGSISEPAIYKTNVIIASRTPTAFSIVPARSGYYTSVVSSVARSESEVEVDNNSIQVPNTNLVWTIIDGHNQDLVGPPPVS